MTERLLVVERVALLRTVEFFAGVPGHVLAAVAEQADEGEHEAGSILIRQDEDGDAMYVVAAGRLGVERDGAVIDELGPGAVVGEFAVLDPEPRSATVTALEPSRTLALRKVVMDELLLDHPEVAVGIIGALVRRIRSQVARRSASGSPAAS